jgi:iron complex outermembrane recepter protein
LRFEPPNVFQSNVWIDTGTKVRQIGSTLSLHFDFNTLSIKPYITWQKSELLNFSPYLVSPQVNSEFNIHTVSDSVHTATPSWYGGLTMDWQPLNKLNIYINPYFFGKNTYYYLRLIEVPNSKQYYADIPAQILLNIKVGYQIDKRLNLFVNVRNLFSHRNYQHFHTDRIQPSYLFGINFEM